MKDSQAVQILNAKFNPPFEQAVSFSSINQNIFDPDFNSLFIASDNISS
jgi:hypothetical protein